MSIQALLNTLGTRCRTLPLVILYVTEGCNLSCITCSYRTPRPNELSLEDIARLAEGLGRLGLRHIVCSGGEPLMRRDLPEICLIFRKQHVRQSLLTNGLLLEKRFAEIRSFFHEIIVSLDGPTDAIHDGIRGAEAFHRILGGIREVTGSRERPQVSLRTVVQKRNFRSLPEMVRLARDLGVDRISFLAADVLSESFGRAGMAATPQQDEILLAADEVREFADILERTREAYRKEFESSFIAESPEKLNNILQYYEALLGLKPFPRTVCNAPMVSTVITSTGDLLPCFFLPGFSNVRDGELGNLLNGAGIRSTREGVRQGLVDRCKTCVCTLHVSPAAALAGRF